MHSFDAILECLCLSRSTHYDVLEEQPALDSDFPHEKAQHPPTTQSLAETAYYNTFGQNPGNRLYVGNLPYQAGWQDLKDLFTSAGNIICADINIGADGRPKGSGTVIFETSKDAQQAISMYNGFDWYGHILEVREDRYAGLSGPGGYRGGGFLGTLRGFRGGLRDSPYGGRGDYGRGGYGHNLSDQDLYTDYPGPDQLAGGYGGTYEKGFTGTGGYSRGYGDEGGYESEPSQQIMVSNLPRSTANEDLVELLEITGQVELAEILFDGTQSKVAGVVQFTQVAEAETAIAKFQRYMYGGRPLDVRFNDRWHIFTPTAAKGGQAVPVQPDAI